MAISRQPLSDGALFELDGEGGSVARELSRMAGMTVATRASRRRQVAVHRRCPGNGSGQPAAAVATLRIFRECGGNPPMGMYCASRSVDGPLRKGNGHDCSRCHQRVRAHRARSFPSGILSCTRGCRQASRRGRPQGRHIQRAKSRTPPSRSASTSMMSTTGRRTRSSRTPPAPRIASRRSPRCCMKVWASGTA